MNDHQSLINRLLKNPYHRMGAIAVFLVFAAMHVAYGEVRSFAPEGTRTRLLATAAIFAVITAVMAAALGARFQRKLDRLTGKGPLSGHLDKPTDEFFLLNQRVSGMARDLESRVKDLEGEKARLDAMLRSMQEGLVVISRNKEILLMNPAAGVLLGIDAERVMGEGFVEIARNSDLERLVSDALDHGLSVSGQIRFFNPEERHLLVSAAPYQTSSGDRQAAFVFHDVTEIHRLEGLRREFVANVSHELKTPLTSLQGFIETMLAGAWQKPDHAKRFLDMMDEDARRLSRLIHDLLDLSKIESGGGTPRREPVDPAESAAKVIAGLSVVIAQKNLSVDNALLHGEVTVSGDPGQIEQVWVNLLENAVKFTPEGGRISVLSFREAGSVRYEVTDTGAGIPEAALERVFERFYRVDPARSREMGGTGLGLSIVKHIVEQHGGTAGAHSPGPGLGSTFFFTLPVQSAA